MTTVYIGVGSNLNSPIKQVQKAVSKLSALPKTAILNRSNFYSSRPLGPQNQPDYINAVVALETRLSPIDLLKALQNLESRQGRNRCSEVRWGARTLDLDILLYDKSTIHNQLLSIPHPQLQNREFVLHPLCEIAPNLILSTGSLISDLKALCSNNGMKRLVTTDDF
ncbi:2-amino-4-hydroxy-6-hydroxymethyldihydropteridine diphosphokinase [Coxiella endosymbiont of Amblyomma sculptum]|uniref:2-amino-4-hydroxy-6- hydroxymethyldihydropteridine diphosphokinase n=1 Tax=Coxiella endosymbiont of Amblyomma sculptum TaxID=2487929 RepID=UPI00132EB3CE|nr:2-amino-4-hydroxy-6-hydroxymethyldihydropteridine diphosphokinase [Coxiella endosymbiont of Amblyomma sculptum]QHG92466.1 2-amino-4-hydroxy-6-hydroxymethyldihydropteridine diphosphokinase [Coxiella endosymbiont of Amblyomma sculptum]